MFTSSQKRLLKANRLKPVDLDLAVEIKCDPTILRYFPIGLPNLKVPTMGGLLFWKDKAEIQGWRLQRHILTGHWRLLDPDDVRCAWGTNAKMVDIFTRAAQATKQAEDNETKALCPPNNIEMEVEQC